MEADSVCQSNPKNQARPIREFGQIFGIFHQLGARFILASLYFCRSLSSSSFTIIRSTSVRTDLGVCMSKKNILAFSRVLLLGLLIPVQHSFAAATEMIDNGGFATDATSWNLAVHGGAATGQVVKGEYVTTITQAGTLPWHVQFTQSGFNLEQGHVYKLSFKARADSARALEVNVGQGSDPYTSYVGNFSVQLTKTMQPFTKTFTMKAPTDNNSRFEFNSGLAAVSWTLDDVSLVEVVAPAAKDTAAKPVKK